MVPIMGNYISGTSIANAQYWHSPIPMMMTCIDGENLIYSEFKYNTGNPFMMFNDTAMALMSWGGVGTYYWNGGACAPVIDRAAIEEQAKRRVNRDTKAIAFSDVGADISRIKSMIASIDNTLEKTDNPKLTDDVKQKLNDIKDELNEQLRKLNELVDKAEEDRESVTREDAENAHKEAKPLIEAKDADLKKILKDLKSDNQAEAGATGAEAGAQTGAEAGATGAEAGAQTGAQAGAEAGAQTGAQEGAQAGAQEGAQEGAQPGAEDGAEVGDAAQARYVQNLSDQDVDNDAEAQKLAKDMYDATHKKYLWFIPGTDDDKLEQTVKSLDSHNILRVMLAYNSLPTSESFIEAWVYDAGMQQKNHGLNHILTALEKAINGDPDLEIINQTCSEDLEKLKEENNASLMIYNDKVIKHFDKIISEIAKIKGSNYASKEATKQTA